MAHAFTAIMNGRDIRRFLDIPDNLLNRKVCLTVDPVDTPLPNVSGKLQSLFANAPQTRISKKIAIDALMDEMNDALP